jgi:exosortase E/protease (VPEID-CTERM system)
MAEGVAWVFGWAILGMAALISLGLASMPVRFWRRLVKRSRRELINACGLGVAAYLLGIWSERLWGLLQGRTFAMVVLLLKLVGLTIQTDPAQYMISTPNFAVDIAPLCSGIEGIGLVAVFLAVYLWLYRIELRFPHALVLLPAGMLLIWLLNGVRIAALILLGSFAPEAATRGFHSVAGWLFFNSVICGLVAASRHLELFRTSGGSSKSLSV